MRFVYVFELNRQEYCCNVCEDGDVEVMLAAIDSTSYFRVSLMGVISARRLDLPGKGLDNGKAIQVACLNTRGSSEEAAQVPFGRESTLL